MMTDEEILQLARAWNEAEPSMATKSMGAEVLRSNDLESIRDHYGERLKFGTAGLRGRMGPGPNRMNMLTVRRAAIAFVRHVKECENNRQDISLVVGFDARYGSHDFARETARVFGTFGVKTFLYQQYETTPMVAFAITALGAQGGVIVTASHNPPSDNGYKVYWSNGAQIIPPHDVLISEQIDGIEGMIDVEIDDFEDLVSRELICEVPSSVRADYFDRIFAERVCPSQDEISVVYTAMHGVGFETMKSALNRRGGVNLIPVTAQVEPDPDFSTVAFPNPEEDGAMDMAIDVARQNDGDVIFANDPDADRLCVAVPESDGDYRVLTGNEVGSIVGDELLRYRDVSQSDLVATTIVSSRLLQKIARHYGVDYQDTLTGFKWLANAAIQKESTGGRFIFGYEEALGYSIGPVVRDKDGISVALILSDLIAALKSKGQTLLDRLTELYRIHGVHMTRQKSLTLTGSAGRAQIEYVMNTLRTEQPRQFSNLNVVSCIDYQTRSMVIGDTTSPLTTSLPVSNVLEYALDEGSRILVRPSGTEPKIKFYFESVVPMSESENLSTAEANAQAQLKVVEDSLFQYIDSLNAQKDGDS